MIKMIVYWYPKCSTCKKAVQFLEDRKLSYRLKNIKEEIPTNLEIEEWIKKYSLPIKKLFNTSGLVYKELNLKEKLDTYSLEEQIDLLSKNGMLIKRPICILEDDILIGFKEKEWIELLGDKNA